MLKFIIRSAIACILTYGMWHWYNVNVLSKLDIEAQLQQFEENFDPSDFGADEYEDEEELDFAYDEYDNESDW